MVYNKLENYGFAHEKEFIFKSGLKSDAKCGVYFAKDHNCAFSHISAVIKVYSVK